MFSWFVVVDCGEVTSGVVVSGVVGGVVMGVVGGVVVGGVVGACVLVEETSCVLGTSGLIVGADSSAITCI